MMHRLRQVGGVAALVALVAAAGATTAQAPAPAGGRTVWDGVYTSTQAERGSQLFTERCSLCHGQDGRGGAGSPAVMGPEFAVSWSGKSAAELYDYVKTQMPPGQAGSLSDQEYADVLAALFQLNQFPATGAADLPAAPDALKGVQITRKTP